MYNAHVYNTTGQMPNTDPAIDGMRRKRKELCTYVKSYVHHCEMQVAAGYASLLFTADHSTVDASYHRGMCITTGYASPRDMIAAGCASWKSPQDMPEFAAG